MNKRIASVAVAASLLAGTGIGAAMTPLTALAADSSTPAAADSTKRTPGQWLTDALQGLVDKGTITEDQSKQIETALEEARPERPGAHMRGGAFVSAGVAAEALGISVEDLMAAHHDGKSLGDVAKDKGVDVQKVIDALVAASNSRLDKAVTDGKLTQEQADAQKAKTVERITEMVNNPHPAAGKIRHGFGPGGGITFEEVEGDVTQSIGS